MGRALADEPTLINTVLFKISPIIIPCRNTGTWPGLNQHAPDISFIHHVDTSNIFLVQTRMCSCGSSRLYLSGTRKPALTYRKGGTNQIFHLSTTD